ncbi:Hypothetical_protein [Hexamita inflata]|uniref:Hypothetical_protein n=1 Tax=Hexamita inflata TaxID=28002 RepID=A0AA86PK90_9EUKA|nr:Hypothetical protein HINF_LOCUS27447 [Hexamita inflata]
MSCGNLFSETPRGTSTFTPQCPSYLQHLGQLSAEIHRPRGSAAIIIDNSTLTLGAVETDSFNSVILELKQRFACVNFADGTIVELKPLDTEKMALEFLDKQLTEPSQPSWALNTRKIATTQELIFLLTF